MSFESITYWFNYVPLVYFYFGATLELKEIIPSSVSGGSAPRPRVWDLRLPLQAPQHPQLSDPSTAYE